MAGGGVYMGLKGAPIVSRKFRGKILDLEFLSTHASAVPVLIDGPGEGGGADGMVIAWHPRCRGMRKCNKLYSLPTRCQCPTIF